MNLQKWKIGDITKWCVDKVLFPLGEWKKPRNERTQSFKDDLFFYLRDRWAGLFGSTCDVVLFDLTSAYS